MRVLLDENLSPKLRHGLAPHEAVTVAYLNWHGLQNGDLLDAAEAAGFDVFLTGDQSLEYEQNIAGRRIAVVSLSAHNWRIIRPHLAKIVEAVGNALPGTVTRADCGKFSRKRKSDGQPG
jgi:hypothetical protein